MSPQPHRHRSIARERIQRCLLQVNSYYRCDLDWLNCEGRFREACRLITRFDVATTFWSTMYRPLIHLPLPLLFVDTVTGTQLKQTILAEGRIMVIMLLSIAFPNNLGGHALAHLTTAIYAPICTGRWDSRLESITSRSPVTMCV